MFSPELKKELLQKLERVEEQQQKSSKLISKSWWIFAAIGFVGAIVIILSQGGGILFIPAVIIIVIAFIVALIITFLGTSKVRGMFNHSVLIPAIQKKYKNFAYLKNHHIPKSDFLASDIFRHKSVDRYNGEDFFSGKRDKTAFKFSQIKAEEKHTRRTSNGGTQTYYTTVFEGILMIADFNKVLQSNTRVIEQSDHFFEKLFAGKRKVSLENPSFEKIFNTYSDNQVEARYILTPAMMENILKLKQTWGAKIGLSFRGNHMYIAIHSRNNYFDVSGRNYSMQEVERIIREVEACLSIIDVLDLNTRIWTKQ